jgi:hypothetical protein
LVIGFGEIGGTPGVKESMWRDTRKDLATVIRSHPRFAPAMQRFTSEYLDWRRNLGVLNKVLSNLGREHLLEHVMYFHFMRQDGEAENGATFERLAALSAARDLIGARAARSALALAQTAGFVVAGRSRDDRRMRVFEPTELLLHLTREAYALPLRILDELAPRLRICDRIASDPGYISHILARLGDAYLKSEFTPRPTTDPFQNVLRLEGGRPIVATAVNCHWRGRDLPTSQEIAWQFYVSPSQIRAVLKTAEAGGLMETGNRGRLIDAAPLTRAYVDATCYYLALYAHHAFDLDADAFADS